MALMVLTVFGVTTATAVQMTTSTQDSAGRSTAERTAHELAEAGINNAEATLYYQNTSSGNPSAANLFGCNGLTGANDTTGPSNCAIPAPKVFCITAASNCTLGQAGSASVYGYFSGVTAAGSYNGISVPASTWLFISTGYAANTTSNGLVTRTVQATVKISPLGSGGVASVWNHVYITAPLVANTCQFDISGSNGVNIKVPIYTIGNVCLGSNTVTEATGQPVDLQVGGKLSIGTGSVGTSAAVPITSGVVVGGCTTGAITTATTACDSGSYHYWVGKKDTYISQSAPGESTTDIEHDYSTFDPGPLNTCLAGTTPAPLADNKFDSTVSSGEGSTAVPDASGSGSAGTAFEVAPNFSYACISKNGTSTGYLIWNNGGSPITVSGITVAAKTLAMYGSIFFDSNVTISQTLTYTGTAVIEAAGWIHVIGNSTAVCAVAGGTNVCNSTNWQGTSGNNSMLTIAALVTNSTSGIQFQDNSQWFQGSVWCQPSSSLDVVKNTTSIEGPMSVGSLTAGSNSATLLPLPVIKNMPPGAPVPPNTNVLISPPSYK